MSAKGRVLVAMSGGVDSSVAAVLLSQQGYEVIGVTMKTWDYAGSGGRTGKEVGCCTLDSMNDARAIALKHGFTHFIVDIRAEFGDWVIDRFTADYLSGRTPNPCVLCNTHIKWEALARRADALDCEYIATGHYARVRQDEVTGRSVLMRGLDAAKDQSYALWGVSQPNFARTIFPIGSFDKVDIRRMAEEFGLFRVAAKPDSYEICFVPDNDYRRFLRERVGADDERFAPGDFVDSTGATVGRHQGYPFYTIGQRRGLGLALGYPVFVTDIDSRANRVTVGPAEELDRRVLVARELNMVRDSSVTGVIDVVGKIRYNDAGAPCQASQTGKDELRVIFPAGRRAIAPGQAVVLYDGDEVVAGAWIKSVEVPSPQLA